MFVSQSNMFDVFFLTSQVNSMWASRILILFLVLTFDKFFHFWTFWIGQDDTFEVNCWGLERKVKENWIYATKLFTLWRSNGFGKFEIFCVNLWAVFWGILEEDRKITKTFWNLGNFGVSWYSKNLLFKSRPKCQFGLKLLDSMSLVFKINLTLSLA